MDALSGGLLAIIGVLITALIATLPRAMRNASAKDAVDFLERTTTALRGELSDTERRCEDRLDSQKASAEADARALRQELHKLEGRVEALTEGFADKLAEKILERMK